MRKKRLPPLPPLSLEVLRAVQAVEQFARIGLHNCSNQVGMRFNVEEATRLLRTCVVTAFDVQIQYYASLSHYCPHWIRELKAKTIETAIGLFPPLVSGEVLRGELVRTIDDHLAQKSQVIKNAKLLKSDGSDRRELRDSYLANFPDAKILDICWAASQHYREWKRWLKQELKNGSTPDRAFRRILTSGKSPGELSKKPRPSGWQ